MNKWISIEKKLPKYRFIDILKGYTEYIAKTKDGEEFVTKVHNSKQWLNLAKAKGITHWKKK